MSTPALAIASSKPLPTLAIASSKPLPGHAATTGEDIGLATGVFSPPAMARDIALDPKAAQKEGIAAAGIFGGAMAGAAAAPLLAPSASTATVGTGILDASGDEIMKDIITQGPSAAVRFLSHPVIRQAMQYAIKGIGIGAGYGLLREITGIGEP